MKRDYSQKDGGWCRIKDAAKARAHRLRAGCLKFHCDSPSFQLPCADYTAHVIRPDGSKSQACEFAVRDLDKQLPKEKVSIHKEWGVRIASDNIKIVAVYLWSKADSYGRHALFVSDE